MMTYFAMSNPEIPEFSASNFSYTASVCSKKIRKILDSGQITGQDIPKGIYIDLKEFLNYAKEGAKEENRYLPRHVKTTGIYRVISECFPEDIREKLTEKKLGEYAAFIESLTIPHALDLGEKLIAEELRKLFKNINKKGESERYDKHMRESHANHPKLPYN